LFLSIAGDIHYYSLVPDEQFTYYSDQFPYRRLSTFRFYQPL
jgi:hypothetical protein